MPRDDAETRKRRRKAIQLRHEAGMSSRAIGRALGLGKTTVAFYLAQITAEKSRPGLAQKSRPVDEPVDQADNVVQLRRAAQ